MKSSVRFIAPLLACLTACASATVPVPTVADARRGSAHFPDLTLNELSHGRSLYVSRCGSCHVLKAPLELTPEQWQAEVVEMRRKNGVRLSDSDARAIIRYLAVAASNG